MKLRIILSVLLLFSLLKVDANSLAKKQSFFCNRLVDKT